MEQFITQDPSRNYPTLNIERIQNPSRFYAVPFLGGLFKIIILIPVAFELIFLFLAEIFITIINSFFVLITSKYWPFAYTYNLGLIRFLAKITFYFNGLTDKYPGFDFNLTGFTLDIPMPENPNKLYAIPLLGGLIRSILLIPYIIWNQVLSNAANIGVVISSFPVLFTGRYPESTYELARDSFRVSQGSSVYMLGLSDKYPSFYISFNHKTIKIILLVLGFLATISNVADNKLFDSSKLPIPTPPQAQFCTQEVKECPDGSFVGRIPPSCEFAACTTNEVTREETKGNWTFKIISSQNNRDELSDLHLINNKTKEDRVIGKTYVITAGKEVLFNNDGSEVIFINGTDVDYPERANNENISFYSTSQGKIIKLISLKDLKEALPSQATALDSRVSQLMNLALSPDGKKVAVNSGYPYEFYGGPIIIIDTNSYKISTLNFNGKIIDWKDNNVLRYEVRGNSNYEETGQFPPRITKEVNII